MSNIYTNSQICLDMLIIPTYYVGAWGCYYGAPDLSTNRMLPWILNKNMVFGAARVRGMAGAACFFGKATILALFRPEGALD